MSAGIAFAGVDRAFERNGAGQVPVFSHFDLEVRAGELVALVGRSGVGKTTLLHMAAGLDRPDRGAVRIGVADRPARIGMVFQQPRLLPWLTVGRNVEVAADAAGVPSRARALLAAMGLADRVDAYPATLSGGQKQRVALARAFAVDPDVLLLDEPFSALDEITARRLRLALQDLWCAQPPTGILITHNMLEAAFLADRIVLLGGTPAKAQLTLTVDVPRPRQPEDERLFAIHRALVDALERA